MTVWALQAMSAFRSRVTSGCHAVFAQVNWQQDAPTDGAPPQADSAGSIGHPHLCFRPCVYLLKTGTCSEGSGCGFCHMPHQELREQKLAKSARARAQSMPKQDFIRMVWRLLENKLHHVDQEAVWTVHEILQDEIQPDHDQTSASRKCMMTPSRIWRLQQEIRGTHMNLASLVAFAARQCSERNQDRLRNLLFQMRKHAGEQ